MYKSVYLKKGKEESLKRFHPWIFSGAIQAMDEGIEEGDIVRVFTRSGEFIAIGHYQIGSIAVRVLSFRDIEHLGCHYIISLYLTLYLTLYVISPTQLEIKTRVKYLTCINNSLVYTNLWNRSDFNQEVLGCLTIPV